MVKAIAVYFFILLSLATVSSFSFQKSNERRVRRYSTSSTEETSQMTLPLSGKTAFITGSSGGIGKAIASRFAKAGANIILHYNLREEGATRTQEEINNAHKDAISSGRDTPGKCIGIVHADFRDPKNVHKMFQGIVEDNRLDILINNAGIVTKLAVEDDDDDLSVWHETQAVNLHAPLQLMRLFQKYIKSQSKGSSAVIINNSSIHGSRSVEYMQAYAASKAALDSLTRGLALEYAQDGIRVNGIAPGVVPVER